MALISYSIQLSTPPSSSGPGYNVFYSTNCTEYTLGGIVNLPTTESIDYIELEETATCIKLVSRGNCQNEVVSGSTPSSSSYNTHLVTLTEKNGAGPDFLVYENTGSLYTYVATAELAAGGTFAFEAGTPLNAVRLRSNGVCTNQKEVFLVQPPTPTPPPVTPTPTPSPTPGPVTPTPTPQPTAPPNCYTFTTIYSSVDSALDVCCLLSNTKTVTINATSLALATAVYDDDNCGRLRTIPTYYTQNLNDYYYWNGLTFQGPFSCPGCP